MKNISAFSLLFFALSFFTPPLLHALCVSDVRFGADKKAKLEFSKNIAVAGISYDKDKNTFLMPVEKGRYANIRILSKKLYFEILGAPGDKKAACSPSVPSVNIKNAKKLKSPVRILNIEAVFDGDISATLGVLKFKGGKYKVVFPDNLIIKSPALKKKTEGLTLKYAKENNYI